MTRYELSRDKAVTVSALVLEVLCIISLVLLGDAIVAQFHLESKLGIQTVMSNHLSVKVACIIFLIIQYLLVAVELIARYRVEKRSFTIPLVFLPGGNVLRLMIMLCLEAAAVAVRLVVYFLSVLFQFIFLIFRLDKVVGTAHIVDLVDRFLEPVEYFVNSVYNSLYYNKIQKNGNVFNSVFNCNLTLRCINH